MCWWTLAWWGGASYIQCTPPCVCNQSTTCSTHVFLDPFHCEFQHRTYKLSIGVRNSFLSAKNIFWFCCLVMLALPCQLFLRLVIYMATVKDFEPEPLFLSVLLSIIPANICSWSEFEFTLCFHKHSITSALFPREWGRLGKGIISHFGIHLGTT